MKADTFLLASALLGSAVASPFAERAACNADNCARAVTGTVGGQAAHSSHLADCSSFAACTVTPSTSVVTVTVTTTASPLPMTTVLNTPVTNCPTAVPSYANVCQGTSKYASACSCAGITKSYSTTTTPVFTLTKTVMPTSSSPSPTDTCTAFSEVLDGPDEPITYRQYYSGSGTTLAANNPGNEYEDPITVTYDGSLPKCSAAADCASYAAFANYYQFDLHYLNAEKSWECKMYFDPNSNPSYYNQKNSDVGAAYGYSS